MSYTIGCLKCVKSDWHHKWCSLYNYRLYDYVKGPMKFPMVTVPIPYVIKEKDEMNRCDCTQYIRECYSKPGIPDPWSEYLIFRRESEKGKDLTSDFPKCDIDITRYLDQNYRIYIGQGIPDPWKKWTRIEPLEPNFDNLKKNLKSYVENLRIGPGSDMYDMDRVCCPNCDRQLLVLCMKKSSQEGAQIEKREANTESDLKPVEEKSVQENVYTKEACVETDYLPETKSDEVQTSKTCGCKLRKICNCNNCLSCPVCSQLSNEAKTEQYKCKENDSCCSCKKKSVKYGFFYNCGLNCPMRSRNIGQQIPVVDKSRSCPLPKLDHGHLGFILPFFWGGSNQCGCTTRQLIGFEEKNNHGLEIQLICPKCESKEKKRRKTKSEQRKENHFPCHCKNKEQDNFQKYSNEFDDWNYTCKLPKFKKHITQNKNFNSDHPCRCHSKEANKARVFEARDYLNLLKILGCTSSFLNDHKMYSYEPKATRSKKISKEKRLSFHRSHHSNLEDNIFDINRGFRDLDRDLLDHDYKHYGISGRPMGEKNELEAVQRDLRNNGLKQQIPRGAPCNSYNTCDELRKMRTRSRRQKCRNTFKKELNYFLSNYGKNLLSNDSDSSSRTRGGELNTETKRRQSN